MTPDVLPAPHVPLITQSGDGYFRLLAQVWRFGWRGSVLECGGKAWRDTAFGG